MRPAAGNRLHRRRVLASAQLLPRDDLAVADINRASWNQCRAVAAVGLRDVQEVAGPRTLVRG